MLRLPLPFYMTPDLNKVFCRGILCTQLVLSTPPSDKLSAAS